MTSFLIRWLTRPFIRAFLAYMHVEDFVYLSYLLERCLCTGCYFIRFVSCRLLLPLSGEMGQTCLCHCLKGLALSWDWLCHCLMRFALFEVLPPSLDEVGQTWLCHRLARLALSFLFHIQHCFLFHHLICKGLTLISSGFSLACFNVQWQDLCKALLACLKGLSWPQALFGEVGMGSFQLGMPHLSFKTWHEFLAIRLTLSFFHGSALASTYDGLGLFLLSLSYLLRLFFWT